MENKIIYTSIAEISANPMNPRKSFDEKALAELAESIKEVGLLQPITIRPIKGGYQVVCGERRWRAAGIAGLAEIPTIVRELSDDEAIDVAITENLQRKDVAPLEEADSFKYLLESKGKSIGDLCARFAKSEFYVRSRLKLLDLIADFRAMLDAGEISTAQAMEIAKFDADIQASMIRDHFGDSHWNSWRGHSAKALYVAALHNYTRDLERYSFDKSACEVCPNCSKNFSLFETDEMKCQERACLERKDIEHRASVAVSLQKKHPEAEFITRDKDCKLKEALEAQGHAVNVQQYCWPDRVGAVITKELKAEVAAGESKLVIYICDEPYLGSIDTNRFSGGGNVDGINTLLAKDQRNKEIQEEKTVDEVRSAIAEMDLEALSTGETTAYESQLMLFILAKSMKKEQQICVGTVKGWRMLDEEAWDVAMNATPEQIAYIYRCCILNQIGDHTRRDFKTGLFFDWVNARDSSIVPAAELKNREIYLKRKEKIDARIAEIQLAEEK